jgi:carboxypeptidase C (cathepsin A)
MKFTVFSSIFVCLGFPVVGQESKPAPGAAGSVETVPVQEKDKNKEKAPGEAKPPAPPPTDAKPASKPAPPKKPEEAAKPDAAAKDKPSVTRHAITINGKRLNYTATAGTIPLSKPTGEPRANVFYVAYTLNDKTAGTPAAPAPAGDGANSNAAPPPKKPAAANTRPVTFCFNGGPGSSAVWLHLGAFGPRRVEMSQDGIAPVKPPFQLVDNAHTLLESTDLVFIDPVSTGYSRAEKGEDAKQFHGYMEDVESVGDFIRLYVSRNLRWQSPKFIMGESYGGIRCAGLSSHLQSRYGMYLNGVIIVSGVLDFQTLTPDSVNDVPYVLYLPSFTATAYYHKKLGADRMKDFAATLQAADAFAQGRYATALLKGGALSAQEKDAIAAEVSSFTSLPKDYVLRQNLRIGPGEFFGKLLENERKAIGRFDARVTGDPDVGDPSYHVVYGAYASTFNAYVRRELNVENDQPYEILSRQVQPWNYQPFTNRYVNVAESLGGAMKANPALKLFVASGYYDLATPSAAIRYSIDHLDLGENLRANVRYGHYEGGHMMYTNVPELEKLSRDISQFIREAK